MPALLASRRLVERAMPSFQLFLVALDEPTSPAEQMAEWLDADERAQWAGIAHLEPRRRYLVAHAALRLILARIMGRRPAEIQFRKNAWGRPETDDGPSFNMSHSDARALIAVAQDGCVGVDIEKANRLVKPEVFADVSSAAERVETVGRLLARKDRLQFWVRKEAVLKAHGRGLSCSPSALTVGAHACDLGRWRQAELVDRGATHRFSFVDLALPHRLIGALATSVEASGHARIEIAPLTISTVSIGECDGFRRQMGVRHRWNAGDRQGRCGEAVGERLSGRLHL